MKISYLSSEKQIGPDTVLFKRLGLCFTYAAADQIFINYGKAYALTGLNLYSYACTKQLLTACTTTPCSADFLNTINEEMISIKLTFDATVA